MQSPPILLLEIESRISGHVHELLSRWWAEQGATKQRNLELMASILPFERGQPLRALDLCCGPGDAGRTVFRQYPKAEIDFVDRDPFLVSICKAVNQRDGIPGRIFIADLVDAAWDAELPGDYDAVVIANALHWLDLPQAERVIRQVQARVRSGGVLVFAEPARLEDPFAAGFAAWKANQPPRYSSENWRGFWLKANAVLGYDHVALMGSRLENRIDERLSSSGWRRLAENAGFADIEILWRDADQVIIAAVKP